jgi:glycosyltransferase involved in cell wall biosynthesis
MGGSVTKIPLSCFIIAKNEEDRIASTIRSVRDWVDEVVVVDSESSDATVSVSVEAGARVITQPWLGFGAQKRFAEDQCRNDWVLNLDADEVVTPRLAREIESLFANRSPPVHAYEMPVDLVYPGDDKPRLWARDHIYVRLYNRRIVRFRNSPIHDSVVTTGHQVGRLKGAIYHHSIRSFDHLKIKLKERMELSIQHRQSSLIRMASRVFLEFPLNFYKYYLVRRHFTGGLKGLRYALLSAYFRSYRIWHSILRGQNPIL